jgi:thiamine-phosphate diphosphorylase
MLVTGPAPEEELLRMVAASVAGGVSLVQVRLKELPVARVAALLPRLRAAVVGTARLLVNHPDWRALAAQADGVHLPEHGGAVAAARCALGGRGMVGRSVHTLAAARAAEAEGADYVIAGSIFSTRSHPGAAPAGLPFLREVADGLDIPVLAIGGITPENAGACLQAGAAGVAVLSPLMDADDPQSKAAAYRAAMDRSAKRA